MPEREVGEGKRVNPTRPIAGERRVEDYMTKKVFTIRNDKKLIAAKEVMEWAHVRHVPVVDAKGTVVGMVSQRDLLAASLPSLSEKATDADRKQHLWAVKLESIMRTPVVTVAPTENIREAARILRHKKIGCLPVVDGGKLVGILTDYDLLRVAEEL